MRAFIELVRLSQVPQHDSQIHDIVSKLKLILNTFPILLLRPPPPAPKYDEIVFENPIHRRHRGRDCWEELSNDGARFRNLTGETPEDLATIIDDLMFHLLSRRHFPRRFRPFKLTARNRMLMIFIWLRQYPREELLAAWFGVSTQIVSKDIQYLVPVLWHYFRSQIKWPNHEQWLQLRGAWEEFPDAVGAIDGTPTEINRPQSEPQHEFYSGHRHYHCISTQIIISNDKNIVFLRSGFPGHSYDASQYRLLPEIGNGLELHLPENVYLLADSIYPNRYPLLTPFKNNQMGNLNREDVALYNLAHRRCRVFVEHAISYFKTYGVIKGIYRHERWFLPVVADVCAALAHRHIVVNQQLR